MATTMATWGNLQLQMQLQLQLRLRSLRGLSYLVGLHLGDRHCLLHCIRLKERERQSEREREREIFVQFDFAELRIRWNEFPIPSGTLAAAFSLATRLMRIMIMMILRRIVAAVVGVLFSPCLLVC